MLLLVLLLLWTSLVSHYWCIEDILSSSKMTIQYLTTAPITTYESFFKCIYVSTATHQLAKALQSSNQSSTSH